MTELYRYAAFISYSSKDSYFAKRLHRALEGYHIPISLGKFDLIGGGKPNRIYPVFRDREELPAGDLGERIQAALKVSAALIVVCSPNSAASPWVQKEVQYFESLGRRDRVFAIIVGNAPLTDESGADVTSACFPMALRNAAHQEGVTREPLAADARMGKDGFRNAWLKLVAGLVGVTPGQLIDRDRQRRRQQRIAIGVSASGVAFLLAMSGAYLEARTRRSDFTTHASDLLAQGRSIDAISFALAGLPARGDVIGAMHAEASSVLRRTGASVRIDADLGQINELRTSNDGRFLAAIGPHSEGWLRDVRQGGTPLPLGLTLKTEFSVDGRLLLTQNLNRLELRDLRFGGRPKSFNGQPNSRLRRSDLSQDGRFLIRVDEDSRGIQRGTLYDLRQEGAPVPLGRIRARGLWPGVLLSGDSRFLVTVDDDNLGALRDLHLGGDATQLGRLGDVVFSGDGRFLVTCNEYDVCTLRDLHHGGLRMPLGKVRGLPNLGFANNGRYLVTRDQGSQGALRDLHRRGALESLGPLRNFHFSSDDHFLLTVTPSGVGALRDLRSGGAPAPLGRVDHNFLGFSGDGRFLLTLEPGGAGALRDVRTEALTDLGHIDRFIFSTDGHFLLTRDPGTGVYSLRDLHRGREPVSLGQLHTFEFLYGGRLLIAGDLDGATALRDLAAPVARESGSRFRAEVCQASGNALRSFPRALPASQNAEGSELYRQMYGRPWNPCDWRGLAAIFPNTERGDGWFEGIRQWIWLMRARYFNGKDWSCAETTSRASETARERRREMCTFSQQIRRSRIAR